MTIEEKVLNMRHNEFGLCKQTFLGDRNKNTFPEKIDVVVHEKHKPTKVFSLDINDYVLSTENTFVIGTLEWDSHEPCWEFKSCGTRFLEYGTKECMKWLLDFCNTYQIDDEGQLEVIKRDE